MTTPTPDWRKLSAIPWSAQVAQVAAALGYTDIPPEGRSRSFESGLHGLSIYALDHGFALRMGESARFCATAADIAEATRCRGSGPTNEALRTWLRWWGWDSPAKAKPAPEPTDNTRTII